ncbi:unnamed protein product [Onchocerca flexuosa]|nr:unnamed protein product [Onchocerca flexuosa]
MRRDCSEFRHFCIQIKGFGFVDSVNKEQEVTTSQSSCLILVKMMILKKIFDVIDFGADTTAEITNSSFGLYLDEQDGNIKKYKSQEIEERIVFPVSDNHRQEINESLRLKYV